MSAQCTMPPIGWACTREPGHEGPCAAVPVVLTSGWCSPTLARAYADIEKLRSDLAQHPESGIDESLKRVLEAIEKADCELEAVA